MRIYGSYKSSKGDHKRIFIVLENEVFMMFP